MTHYERMIHQITIQPDLDSEPAFLPGDGADRVWAGGNAEPPLCDSAGGYCTQHEPYPSLDSGD